MHVEVKDPDDKVRVALALAEHLFYLQVILSKIYSSEGKFTFTSHTVGEHIICLYSNTSKWFPSAQLVSS